MALTTSIIARVQAALSGTADHGTPKADLDLSCEHTLADGTTSGKADRIYSDQRTLAASATETHDLTSLTDVFGVAISFAKVKAILIRASSLNTNNVVIGNAASNPFVGPMAGTTPTIAVPPGGICLLTAPASGWAVVNATNDNLKIANSGGTTGVTYDIIIVGTSA